MTSHSNNTKTNNTKNSSSASQEFLRTNNIRTILLILVLIAIGSTGFIILSSFRKLFWHSMIIENYFFSDEGVKRIADSNTKGSLEKLQEQFVNSLKERDWGMAAFYTSRLQQIISEERRKEIEENKKKSREENEKKSREDEYLDPKNKSPVKTHS
jgi:hypothetical protein